MVKTIQARLNAEDVRRLEDLKLSMGLSDSEVVRRSIKLLAGCSPRKRGARIIGLGMFASGINDLGSNKAHLKGFGK
jgi:hypothetical protein